MLALDFRTYLENMKMSSSLSKILDTGINGFKSNCQIIKRKKILWNIGFDKCTVLWVWCRFYLSLRMGPVWWTVNFSSYIWSVQSKNYFFCIMIKSWNTDYHFKWNQSCLSRVSNLRHRSNSLISASGCKIAVKTLKQNFRHWLWI